MSQSPYGIMPVFDSPAPLRVYNDLPEIFASHANADPVTFGDLQSVAMLMDKSPSDIGTLSRREFDSVQRYSRVTRVLILIGIGLVLLAFMIILIIAWKAVQTHGTHTHHIVTGRDDVGLPKNLGMEWVRAQESLM